MKLILSNNKEIEVKRVNQTMSENKEQLDISISASDKVDLNSLSELFEENTETITVEKEAGKTIVFEKYIKISMVSRDISDFDDVIRITLAK